MAKLIGRKIIVTGANSGIGLAVTRRFLAEGASVLAVVRRAESQSIFEPHQQLRVLVGDVSQYHSNARAVEAALDHFGGLDCFVANAGVWDFYKKIAKLSSDELESAFDQIMAVNVKAAFLGAHAAYEALKQSQGSLVVTGSNACFRPGGGGALYTASKFALRGMIAQLALEFAPEVRVNGIAPGATNTPLSGSAALGQENKEMNEKSHRLELMGEHIPLGRVSEPEEHTGFYVMLASKESTYMTGSLLVSDGGLTAGQ